MMERPSQDTSVGACEVEELVAELMARCPAVLVAACVPDDGDESETKIFRNGHRAALLGLANLSVHVCLSDLTEDKTDPEED